MEIVLFGLVALIAIGAAAAMIISKNAVHSALFLIVNFICVAFLYLMLEAAFLSMVQIAVYAGAIMVLFLFVIMLLGAENAESDAPTRRYLTIGGAVLPLIFLILMIMTWGAAGSTSLEAPRDARVGPAMVRFVNAAPVTTTRGTSQPELDRAERRFDVFVNDELLVEDLFNETSSSFSNFEPGEYTFKFSPVDTAIEFASTTVSLEAGDVVTVLLSGEAEQTGSIIVVEEPQTPTARNTGRVAVVNIFPGEQAVDLVSISSEQFNDSRTVTPIMTGVMPGTTQIVDLPEGAIDNVAVIQAGTAEQVQNRGGEMNQNFILGRMPQVDVTSDTSQLVVVTARRDFDGDLAWRILPPEADATAPAFGTPRAVGAQLFTTYALPLQIVALLLLAAMVGVIVLTHRDMVAVPKPSRDQRRKVSRPLTSVISSQTGSDLTSVPQIGAPKSEPESGD